MSFWDESFFNYSVPDLNEEPPVNYSYNTIDLNVEPNADVGFDSQASYGFVYDDSKQSNPEEGYEENPAASNVTGKPKRAHQAAVRVEEDAELPPDIEFSLGGQHFEMSIERFVVHLGIYYEPETVRGGWGDEGLVGLDIRYAVHRPQGAGDDDQGSSDQIRPPVHSDDHLRSRPEPGVGDYDRSLLSALTHCTPAVQPGTVFRIVLSLLLPPTGARYTMGWRLYHPHCPDQRHG
ncbi:hypothetical protein R6Q57_002147 [Mikania cordata]